MSSTASALIWGSSIAWPGPGHPRRTAWWSASTGASLILRPHHFVSR